MWSDQGGWLHRPVSWALRHKPLRGKALCHFVTFSLAA